jgi:hypothetical protein
MANFYTIDCPESPWGDYSDILIGGMSDHLGRKDGLIQLERTAPYVPPISFPGVSAIVVTDAFRRQLESSELAGLRFQPVIKSHIVRLDWHTWDRSADEPPEYPESGEPEDYILERPHSPEMSERIGDIWEVLIEDGATARKEGQPSRIVLVAGSWRGGDLFRAEGYGYNYATEKAKAWFEQHAREHVSFKPVAVL